MPPEQNFRCIHFRDETQHFIQQSISHFRCALFDASLAYEFGKGAEKCRECAMQSVQHDKEIAT
jgi:hypothetical protein